MTPPEAIKNLGACPAESPQTVLFPLKPDDPAPQAVAQAALHQFPQAEIGGVCEQGDSSFLLIDISKVSPTGALSGGGPETKDDLIWWINLAELSLDAERMRIYSALSELARSKEMLETAGESDTSIVLATAGAIAASAVGFGMLVPAARDGTLWIRRGLPPDATTVYRSNLRTELRRLMVRKDLCGSLPSLVPEGASWLTRLVGERMMKLLAVGATVAGATGLEKLIRYAVRSFQSGVADVSLPDPQSLASNPVNAAAKKRRLEELRGKSLEELRALKGQIQEQGVGLEMLSKQAVLAARQIHEAILRKSLDRLEGVDGAALGDENLGKLVAQVKGDVAREIARINSERSLFAGALRSMPERLLGTFEIVLGFGVGVTYLEEQWYKSTFFHLRVDRQRGLIEQLARDRAPGILEGLISDRHLQRCGPQGPSRGADAAAEAPAVAAEPGGAPVPAAEAAGELAPAAEGPENASRAALPQTVGARSPRPRPARQILQPGVVYPLAQNFHLVPEPLRPHLEAFRSIPGVAFEMVEPAIVANGSGTATLANGGPLFRVFFTSTNEPGSSPSSATGGGSARNPEGLPKLNGLALPVYIAGNVAAVLVIDHALMKAGVPEQLRGPASFATFYGVNLALYKMGLIERWDLSRAFRGMPLYASGQMLTSIALDQVGIDMGTFWNKAGGIVGGAVPFYLAYKFSQVGTAAESVMGVGMHSMRYAGLAGGAGFLGGLGQALGAAGAITLGNYVGQLATDGIVHATGIADDPDYHLMQFAYDQMLTDISHRYVVGACGAVMKGMQAVAGYCSDDFEQAVHEGLDMKINDLVEASDQMGDQVNDVFLSFGLQDIMEGRAVDLDAIEERMHQFFSENGEGIKNAYALLALTGHRAHRGQRIKEMFDDNGTFRNRAAVKRHLLALVDAQIKSREKESHRLARERGLIRKEGDLTLLADADHLTPAQERFYTQGRGAQLALELLYLNTLRSQLD